MSGIIRRIFGNGKASGEESKNETDDGEVMRSVSRKASYKTWLCEQCEHLSFYKILRCVLCGSNAIKAVLNPVSGIVTFERADMSYTVSNLGERTVTASVLRKSFLVDANRRHDAIR